ncbi:MAG: ParB N-terminal domain-containing protein [Leptolyngbyaceae bacterium]|nr:ParB N-terminal domain-containing protein [Leptolyngbyaceae bacterium]
MPLVEINKITIGRNRRALKDEKIAELMESIRANGLLNPITIDQDFNLIAGLHRLTASRLLGLTEIECRVITCENTDDSRLAEIDENLIRSELDALERSELWLERDQILERMGLRAKPGDNQYLHQNLQLGGGEMISPPAKTTLELAKEAGYTERTFQQGKQIAKNIVPEVKETIRGTPIAKSTTALLKVARAGSQERQQAEQAEQAARTQSEPEEIAQQARLAAEARAKQRELQLVALHQTTAEREAKRAVKTIQRRVQQPSADKPQPAAHLFNVQVGDEWLLDRHLVYCGNTNHPAFIHRLPSNAALAIATPPLTWNHDYLIDEARVVAVVCSENSIYSFCSRQQMPFRYEWLIGNLYVAIFSRHAIAKPTQALNIEGIEAIVAYLISLYTKPNHFVIAPTIGQGEVLLACEKMARICFAGEESPERTAQAIERWQQWTGKQASR